jgi:hypothetical protein
MSVIERGAFERPDVEANRAGCNTRQQGSSLAQGTEWSEDGHDASPLVQAGALQNSQSPVDTEGGGDGAPWNLCDPAAGQFCSLSKS